MEEELKNFMIDSLIKEISKGVRTGVEEYRFSYKLIEEGLRRAKRVQDSHGDNIPDHYRELTKNIEDNLKKFKEFWQKELYVPKD